MGLFFGGGRQARTSNLGELLDQAGIHRRGKGSGSPVPVGWREAQAIPAALDAIRLRHDLIATMPVQVFRRAPGGRPVEVDPPTVLQQPEAVFDIVSWLAATQKSLDCRGNAYGIVVDRDPRTLLPSQIETQHPDWVQPRLDRDGVLYYRIKGKRYEASEVWHERCHEEPGSPVGLSPIGATARTLGINLAAEQFGADFFRDGGHPTALLSSEAEIDEEDAKVAKRRFVDTMEGNREPLVLGGNWSYDALSIAPNESQFLETMKFGVSQVARIFNVDPELIGGGHDGSSITYANREQRALDFLTYRLGTAITRRERALSRLTPRGQFVKLNRASLLATDLLTRFRAYDLGLKNGIYALEEPRLLEDREPLTPEQIAALKDAGLLGKPTNSPAGSEPANSQPGSAA